MRARQPVQPERYPNDWVGTSEAAEMLRISVATFLRKVEEGLLPSPSTVLGNRNPRWNVKSLYDAMAGIVSEQPVSDDDVSDRIAGLTQ